MKLTLQECLRLRDDIARKFYITEKDGSAFLTKENPGACLIGVIPALPAEKLGSEAFRRTYGVKYALYGGAMANGISSVEMAVAMGKAGFMASFGSGGLPVDRVRSAIRTIHAELGDLPFLVNVLNSPFAPQAEADMVTLLLEEGVRAIEASGYMTVSRNLVLYRAAGLSRRADGSVQVGHRIIAKISRKEVAMRFLSPPPASIVDQLAAEGRITMEQAELARLVPMADDLTMEADSGGHTDYRPLIGILPSVIALRDVYQDKYGYAEPVRVGAAGGIGTPAAAMAAFMMGAAYIVTGSVNQACVESGVSDHARELLCTAAAADVTRAPAGDMFEMGATVQVLKRGSMFAMRAQKLYDLYLRYDSIAEIPAEEREKIETTIFQKDLESVWQDCVKFFSERDPSQLERAAKSEKDRMALIFRWYLGQSSRWAVQGEKGREMDYQIWCGPSMGAFNEWTKGSELERSENRRAADVALRILNGAAGLTRLRMAELFGVEIEAETAGNFMPRGFA